MSPFNSKFKRAAGETAITLGAVFTSVVGGFVGLIIGGIIGFPVAFIYGIFFLGGRDDLHTLSSSEKDDLFFQPVMVCAWIGAGIGALVCGGFIIIMNISRLIIALFKGAKASYESNAQLNHQVDRLQSDAEQTMEEDHRQHRQRIQNKQERKRQAMKDMRRAAGYED